MKKKTTKVERIAKKIMRNDKESAAFRKMDGRSDYILNLMEDLTIDDLLALAASALADGKKRKAVKRGK